MATTKEITVNGVVTEVTEFDHSAQEIDDATARALEGGKIDQLLAGKEPSISILPISKGGTGANGVNGVRENIGLRVKKTVPAGGSTTITLPIDSLFLVSCNDNVRSGAVLFETIGSTVYADNVLMALRNWSYSYASGSLDLTLTETNGRYPAFMYVVSLGENAYTG